MKIFKASMIGLIVVFVIGVLATATMIIKQSMIDIVINDSISPIVQNVKYKSPAKAQTDLSWQSFGKISDPTIAAVMGELKKQFPDYEANLKKNLKNSELIDAIYESVESGMPVLCLIAAQDATKAGGAAAGSPAWGIHIGIVAEIDLPGDKIVIGDPYGHESAYSVRDFLKAARFESYENMELFLKFKFAFEIYCKNTIFALEKKPG
ncbi:MAG: hypothetical protein FWG34_13950 [Oscillospiraceae bacterium]|nr:hypothetical protein [Oscillospiraceae bacterium]